MLYTHTHILFLFALLLENTRYDFRMFVFAWPDGHNPGRGYQVGIKQLGQNLIHHLHSCKTLLLVPPGQSSALFVPMCLCVGVCVCEVTQTKPDMQVLGKSVHVVRLAHPIHTCSMSTQLLLNPGVSRKQFFVAGLQEPFDSCVIFSPLQVQCAAR